MIRRSISKRCPSDDFDINSISFQRSYFSPSKKTRIMLVFAHTLAFAIKSFFKVAIPVSESDKLRLFLNLFL